MKVENRKSVFIAMFSAIICIGSFIIIPIGTIPIVLQNMLVILAGLLLGFPHGAASVGLFLVLGTLGFPVFSGGKGGLAILTGPTGGFLIGYFFAAIIVGIIAKKPSTTENNFSIRNILKLTLASITGFCVIYITGIIQYIKITNHDILTAITTCIIPFLIGDLIKLIIVIPIAAKLRKTSARYISSEETEIQ